MKSCRMWAFLPVRSRRLSVPRCFTMFFLPLVTAAVHICFAFPMIARLLALLNLRNVGLFAASTAAAVLVFAVFYGVIYGVTSKKYYEIVKR